MIEALGAGTRLGYCTNVHAGHDLRATLENLERYAVVVRERLGAEELGIGLWLSADAAGAARTEGDWVHDRLRELGLRVFTLNGFPYADFHGPVVKHRVYEPDWGDPRRLEFTLRLVEVLDEILDEGEEGSISTVPIGWPGAPCPKVDMGAAGNHLRGVARRLAELESETGRLIHIDLEPEPGCLLQRSADVVRFFEDVLLRGNESDEKEIRRHLRVCHDACHSAVMFEAQEEAFAAYKAAGIQVGKVQVSSALRACGAAAVRELRRFDEPRYLHQTCIRNAGKVRQFEDLPLALAAGGEGEWRVHFHVPVYLESIGALGTTRDEIAPAIKLALAQGVKHFEVETYAWTVLPKEMRPAELADGIADELRWVMGSQK